MKDLLKIGLIIADEDEYSPALKYVEEFGGKEFNILGKKGHIIRIENSEKDIEVHMILCGIGKINATASTTYLALNKCDIILNCGLSGGVSGVSRGDIVIGTTFTEHDFNLTGFGYKLGEKPGQKYIYNGDENLIKHFLNIFPEFKTGAMVTGDIFVNDSMLREKISEIFNPISCDMETAAIAYVCDSANIPFCSIRRISDDAGEDANTTYRSMNKLAESCLVDIVFEGISKIFEKKNLI